MQPQPSLDLWADVEQLLAFHFMQNAFAGGTVVAVLSGVVGYFTVTRGQTFAAHALSQVGFPGAAGAALVGASPLLGLLAFCAVAALGIAALAGRPTQNQRFATAAIGSVLAFALALGFLFASLYPGFVETVFSVLFGTLIGITDTQVLVLLIVAAAVLAVMTAIGRPLFFASVDPDVASARGVRVRLLAVVFLLVLGLAVAASASITGTLLVFALLVAPAAAAQQITPRPGLGIVLSVVLALAVTWLGLSIAYFSVYPVGFYVTSLGFAVYLIARAVRYGRGFALRRTAVPA